MAAFAQARSPGIYKGEYLKELFRRYGDVDDAPAAPQLPEWCFEDDNDGDVDDDGNVISQESGPSSSGSNPGKKKKEKLKLVSLLHLRFFTVETSFTCDNTNSSSKVLTTSSSIWTLCK